jgi:hypothetical protein
MLRVAIVAVSLCVLAGCVDTGVCSRCLLPKSVAESEIDTRTASVATSVSQASERTEVVSEGYVTKFIDKFPEVVMYALVSIFAALVFDKTGKVNGFLSYITTQIYDRCSSGKRKVLAIINSTVWRSRK